jgi:dihydrodipicolinate synthase/N-acetylneuraminate lyase
LVFEKALRGIYPVLVTPFCENSEIDYVALRRQVDFAIECGCHGLVTTVNAAECTLLSDDERNKNVETVIEHVAGRVPVVVGIAAKTDEQAVHYAQHAQKNGAQAIMSMPPYVAKCNPVQAVNFYRKVDAAIDIPFFVQNFFAPVGTPISAQKLYEIISTCRNVKYIKEESDCPSHVITELNILLQENPVDRFQGIFCGLGGNMMIHEMLRGSCGCMPPPHLTDIFVDIWNLLESGEYGQAISLHNKIYPWLVYDAEYPVTSWKETLRYRGVIPNCIMRRGGGKPFDENNRKEFQMYMQQLEPLFSIRL